MLAGFVGMLVTWAWGFGGLGISERGPPGL